MFPKRERGFLIPLAAVIVVGLGVLALAISRISSQAATASTQEGLAVQAYYAADSAAQYAMHRIFFNAADQTATDTNCANVSGTSRNFSVSGLALCASDITCSVSTASGSSASYYLITSAARCGSGDSLAERTIAVSTYMD